jgi:hypothetical protein
VLWVTEPGSDRLGDSRRVHRVIHVDHHDPRSVSWKLGRPFLEVALDDPVSFEVRIWDGDVEVPAEAAVNPLAESDANEIVDDHLERIGVVLRAAERRTDFLAQRRGAPTQLTHAGGIAQEPMAQLGKPNSRPAVSPVLDEYVLTVDEFSEPRGVASVEAGSAVFDFQVESVAEIGQAEVGVLNPDFAPERFVLERDASCSKRRHYRELIASTNEPVGDLQAFDQRARGIGENAVKTQREELAQRERHEV